MNTRKLICVCGMVILKWILKDLVLFLDLNLHYNTGKSGIFGKANEVILHKNLKISKILQLNLSEDAFRSTTFLH